jgi:hypothetical protein
MQSRAQRRQYGEPVKRHPLSVRYGQRHTRGLEAELESIPCSGLQVRSPRVHVPPPIFPVSRNFRKWNGPPIKALQTDEARDVQLRTSTGGEGPSFLVVLTISTGLRR